MQDVLFRNVSQVLLFVFYNESKSNEVYRKTC